MRIDDEPIPSALGCMRLSTAPDRAEARALETIAAALDAGITLLDTADVYAHGEHELGHNERLIARALAGHARRNDVRVATKGGLTRFGGRWVPDGRAAHLRAACETSLRALGVERLDLYQLHAPDPRTPWATSVRALARLEAEGLAGALGVSNVNVAQLREALDLAPIRFVQLAVSPLDDQALRGGVVALARARGLMVLAHSPLGGPAGAKRLGRDPVLAALGAARGLSAHAMALAWLVDLGLVPLPGASTPEHARECAAAMALRLSDEERCALDARFPLGRRLREPGARPSGASGREVVILMGMPAAGKSTAVARYVERGYARLNRDERGGTLKALARALDALLAQGAARVVLDNTYPTRASRQEVVEAAWKHGVPVRCAWLDTPIEDAQVNAVARMLARYGALLGPEQMRRATREDPNVFDPRAQHRYRRALEPPELDEGFEALERLAFEREAAAEPGAGWVARLEALATADDGVDASRAAALRAEAGGAPILVLGWTPDVPADRLEALRSALGAALGAPFDLATCVHGGGPPICWCRPPLPGLAMWLAHRSGAGLGRWVGPPADRAVAERLGAAWIAESAFFGR